MLTASYDVSNEVMILFESLICWEHLGKFYVSWSLLTTLTISLSAILYMLMNGVSDTFIFVLISFYFCILTVA